jgi:hypothetical protein
MGLLQRMLFVVGFVVAWDVVLATSGQEPVLVKNIELWTTITGVGEDVAQMNREGWSLEYVVGVKR